MTLRATTKTGSEIAAYVKRQFGDDAGAQITDAMILDWINIGQLEIGLRNRVIKREATTDVVKDQREYTFGSLKVLTIEQVLYDGGILENQEFSQARVTINNLTGGKGTADLYDTPVLWYQWDAKIVIWPTPTENITAGLTIYYSEKPTDLSLIGDTLSLPDIYFEPLATFVLAKAYQLDDDTAQYNLAMQLLEGQLMERSEENRHAEEATYPKITFVEED